MTWTKVSLGQCLLGEKSSWTNVPWSKWSLDNCPLDKCINTFVLCLSCKRWASIFNIRWVTLFLVHYGWQNLNFSKVANHIAQINQKFCMGTPFLWMPNLSIATWGLRPYPCPHSSGSPASKIQRSALNSQGKCCHSFDQKQTQNTNMVNYVLTAIQMWMLNKYFKYKPSSTVGNC